MTVVLETKMQNQKELYNSIYYDDIHVSKATFKSGINKPFHSWFRLTPSFGAELVQLMLNKLKASSSTLVLDPFAGASTTLIECKLSGIESIGFEINPLLHFVGKTCLTPPNVKTSKLEKKT